MTQTLESTAHRPRQPELDYLKTVAIFLMVSQHAIEVLANFDSEEVPPSGFFQHLTEFSWEFLCAIIFIFSIGFGLYYTRKKKPQQLAWRGLRLLRDAYLLNIARGVLPPLLVWMVKGGEIDPSLIITRLFTVDVLHFAAVSYFFVALLKQCRVSKYAFFPISAVMLFIIYWIEPTLEGIEGQFLAIPLSFFFYCGGISCFPLFDYFVFLVIGMLVGEFLSDSDLSDRFYIILFWFSLTIFVGIYLTMKISGVPFSRYYDMTAMVLNSDFGKLIMHVLVLLGEFAFFHFVHKSLKKCEKVRGFVRFCGTNLTTVYIIHWIIICWLAALMRIFDIQGGNFETTMLISVAITMVSLGIAKMKQKGIFPHVSLNHKQS